MVVAVVHRAYPRPHPSGLPDDPPPDPAGSWLPLVSQQGNGTVANTTILQQPLDLSLLAEECVADFLQPCAACCSPQLCSNPPPHPLVSSPHPHTDGALRTLTYTILELCMYLRGPTRPVPCGPTSPWHMMHPPTSSVALCLCVSPSPPPPRYNQAIVSFITDHAASPFFLYVPFNHVHTAASNQPDYQYSGCRFRGVSPRGGFGDAVMEMDWLVGVSWGVACCCC